MRAGASRPASTPSVWSEARTVTSLPSRREWADGGRDRWKQRVFYYIIYFRRKRGTATNDTPDPRCRYSYVSCRPLSRLVLYLATYTCYLFFYSFRGSVSRAAAAKVRGEARARAAGPTRGRAETRWSATARANGPAPTSPQGAAVRTRNRAKTSPRARSSLRYEYRGLSGVGGWRGGGGGVHALRLYGVTEMEVSMATSRVDVLRMR